MIDQVMLLDTPVLDRAVCERIFGVRRRRAIDLMQQFGGYQAGNTILIDRLDLVQRLQSMAEEPEVQRERQRKQCFTEQLTKVEKHRRAAAVRIQVGPEAANCTVADLPTGVTFSPGQLTLQYSGVEELLRHLYELAQAAANDFDSFSKVAGGAASAAAI